MKNDALNLLNLATQFQTEEKAREWLERNRWPEGAVCPHCGVIGESFRLVAKPAPEPPKSRKRKKAELKRAPGGRKGLWKCGGCRKQFTVTVGTIFEDSKIPLNKWLLAIYLFCASKKGMSAHQLHRMLQVTYKSAWFMVHRIRYAMTQEPLSFILSGIVEADETYIGGKRRKHFPHATKPGERPKDNPGPVADKAAVFSVLQRGGKVRSQHVEMVTGATLKKAITEICTEDTHVMTDSAMLYKGLDKHRKHSSVNHSADEYVRWDDGVCVTTNAVEGFFANLKRGIDGVYHHVSKKHLHRYLTEFDFRFNNRQMNDGERTVLTAKGFEGKRLMYKEPTGKRKNGASLK